MATRGPICPICGAAHVSCGGGSGAVPIGFIERERGDMGGELERVTLTNGRVVRVNAADKARYAKRGMIAAEPAAPAEATAPGPVTIPARTKKRRPVDDKAVKPADDKGQE